jgi:hypothetical protein
MALTLVQHISSPDRLHIWVGVSDADAPPALTWQIDGQPRAPDRVLRPLEAVLEHSLALKARTNVFAGFFEFEGLAPDSEHEITMKANGEAIVRRVRTLPDEVPIRPQDRLNILLVSCFHRLEDKTGTAGKVLSQLKVRPHLTLFAGDQVYLDLPTQVNFPDDRQWLADKFQNDYLDNWFGHRTPGADPGMIAAGFPQVLALAPCGFLPDDHEYWNNYPAWTTPVENSWTKAGRDNWKAAAEAVYRGFQQTGAAKFGEARTIEIAPLSILLLDTRSQRAPESRERPNDLLGKDGSQALRNWVSALTRSVGTPEARFGMLVTGQSFFSPPAGKLKGAVADYEFADYEADYRFMLEQIGRLTQAGVPLILATGDVHWGRVLAAVDSAVPSAPVYEIISSPTALVSTVIADQAKEVWGAVKGLFRGPEPWPRHSDPEQPPGRFGAWNQYRPALLTRIEDRAKPTAMRGNHALMLRFSRSGGGLDVSVTCYPLAADDGFNAREQWSTEFRLRPPRGA